MRRPLSRLLAAVAILALLLLAMRALWSPEPLLPSDARPGPDATNGADPLAADLDAGRSATEPLRTDVAPGTGGGAAGASAGCSIAGTVFDAASLEPRAGVEVVALRRRPGFDRLFARMQGLLGDGVWTDATDRVDALGRAVTGGDGRFVIEDLPAGLVFVEARDDYAFARSAPEVRLAPGGREDGVEVLVEAGGRVAGRVLGPDGPVAGARVVLRPGLSAFLGQITQRRYAWRETETADDGTFALRGVPPGVGYQASATGPGIALVSASDLEVGEGRTTTTELRAGRGARVEGLVVDEDGRPVAGAEIAMVYLDVSRVLFSADGRTEPVRTGPDGMFRLDHVAPGRVAFVADAEELAASGIVERGVVEGGVYDDLQFVLGKGLVLQGRVVDERGEPIAGALVDVRPIERPVDPDVVKLLLRVRRTQALTDREGRFVLGGLPESRLLVRASHDAHVGEALFGVEAREVSDAGVELTLQRHATVRLRVLAAPGPAEADEVADAEEEPVTRFRVRVQARGRDRRGIDAGGGDAEGERSDPAFPRVEDDGGRRGPERFLRGRGRVRLTQGAEPGERLRDGGWQEYRSVDGTVTLTDVPPGRARIEVAADGYRGERVEIEATPGAEAEAVVVRLARGFEIAGTVRDARDGRPMASVEVTAYRERERSSMFRVGFDREDVDFLGFGRINAFRDQSATTDRDGRFVIQGLDDGGWRLVARHPDRPKATLEGIVLPGSGPEGAAVDVELEIGDGGAVEGYITREDGTPLADALVVAANLTVGSLRSAPADARGFYRIEGLPAGRYAVVRSRLDGDTTNLGYAFLSNLRLKSVNVRDGETTRFDIRDDEAGTVRVVGTVRDANGPVPRAMVTALGSDSDGLLGLGIRAQSTDEFGRFEMPAMKPGSYVFQVSRFSERPEQANLDVEIEAEVATQTVDLELPSSVVRGRVVGPDGEGVAGIRVAAGVLEGGSASAPGLLGLILRNGVSQARTDANGEFELPALAAGTYRITAGARAPGRRSRRSDEFGEAAIEPVDVDGVSPVEGLLLQLPRAGIVRGRVVDASGAPVARAEITYQREGDRNDGGNALDAQLTDLLGVSARPERSADDGTFELVGLTPGTYTIRADVDGVSPGIVRDLEVVEGGERTGVELQLVRGATLRVRARNVDGSLLPIGRATLLDENGQPVTSPISVASVFRRLMRNRDEVEDSGWYTVGGVRPGTYTLVLEQPGQEDLRITRTILDGETVEWDVDVAEELARRDEPVDRAPGGR
jgi:protocatechuate 3,4-dioxygenase beta subunit